jgi:hypothetical protein
VVLATVDTVAQAVSTMLDAALDDDAKELAVRRAGLRLLMRAWQIAWRMAAALAAAALPILAADALGLVPRMTGLDTLMRLDVIVAVSALAMLVGWAWRRRRGMAPVVLDAGVGVGDYGAGERMTHALAFSGPGTTRRLAGLDDRLHSRVLRDTASRPPVFVTSLARGGTTALLEALHRLPEMATHRYMDMPFVAAPLLWSRLRGSGRAGPSRERAHGDGMRIDLDSPEAFDEVFWMHLYPGHYRETGIVPWQARDHRPEAQAFLERHFRKIVRLRRPDAPGRARYLSKNNANIARLALLPRMFPDCDVVLALRDPAAHAASLHRQHLNFQALHAREPFVTRYMRDIGHLEFGALHRPILFDEALLAGHDPDRPDYWLAYWVSAFTAVVETADDTPGLHVVSQDDLRAEPTRTMGALLERLAVQAEGVAVASAFRSGPDQRPDALFDPGLLSRARALHAELDRRAV